ncbi:hypothetical protein AQ616_11485 [Oceanobacillus sp. E9]|uniref:GNAT family N-acetyltransferase n=1 Tax=Oceanobacillus TaxID=182709 RepID=UPI0003489949|nr:MULTISPECIES: GNAT family N-acetyltransferase [Oceanobacillus]OEH54375.1 hypothetical protein AQ616_11485 [Oceanobacillus sp. E9]
MALRLEKITKDFNDINKLKRLFIKAFPKNERLPLWFLLMKADKDFVDFIGFYDEDDFIGFTYLITNKDLTFVLYLAIDSSQRSKGYGGAVLSKIKELYPNNRLILNIEAIISNSQNYEQRVKRKNFYIKNGYVNSGIMLKENKDYFEIMINQNELIEKEYSELIQRYSGIFFMFVKPKFIPYINDEN